MEGKRKAEAHRWFQQAKYDLRAAEWNLQGGFYSTVCFLAQQSGEKALKSILYYIGSRRKTLLTHSLVEMLQEGSRKLKQLEKLFEEARILDMHYIPSRYPNGLPGGYPHQFYGKKMAQKAIKSAEKILTIIKRYYESQNEIEITTTD
jgi:HEPN domain-containing protein